MKMKKTILNSVKILVTTLISIFFLYSCTEEFDYGKSEHAVQTLEFSNVLQTSAMVSGAVITDNDASLFARGICYSTSNNPTVSGPKIDHSQATLNSFTCTLINLVPSTAYFARAYATNAYGTAYGEEVTFTTKAATVPILTATTEATLISQISASSGGIITNSGASNITSRGVCYSKTNTIPTILDTKTNNGTGIGEYTSSLTNLSPNTKYYIRAYATNGVGTAYSDVKSFTTTVAAIPVISSTTAATFISLATAISGGNVISESGATITSRGVCWSSTTSSPTLVNPKTVDGAGIGTFTSSLTNLAPGTTYYVRAYATNSVGTAYASAISFTTTAATIPTGVTTNAITSLSQTTATGGGNITNDGGASITARGICWSSSTSSPTIINSKTVDGSGIGMFTSLLTGLSSNTSYYVRAYATNSAGTTYGAYQIFKTSAATTPTGVSTSAISSVTQTTASSGGTISNDGGAAITSRGVCYSTFTSSPTIYDSTTSNGSGIGSFTSSLTGLSPNSTYYVRGYATNSAGTAYGTVISFSTLASALAVGQSYQGGKIAYIFQSGDSGYVSGETHGIIATSTDQSSAAQWGCSGTSITTNTALGTGQNNTTSIVNSCSASSIAARICTDLVAGAYSDWYLPSYFELQQLYTNKTVIGGFTNTNYWSSSQSSSTAAYSLNFSTGSAVNTSKTSAVYVRAIRKF
jgi:hypothetical protein